MFSRLFFFLKGFSLPLIYTIDVFVSRVFSLPRANANANAAFASLSRRVSSLKQTRAHRRRTCFTAALRLFHLCPGCGRPRARHRARDGPRGYICAQLQTLFIFLADRWRGRLTLGWTS